MEREQAIMLAQNCLNRAYDGRLKYLYAKKIPGWRLEIREMQDYQEKSIDRH